MDRQYPKLGPSCTRLKIIASTLDRILMAYQLPTDLRSLRLTSRHPISSRTAAQAKLITLLDFLGATQLAEYERFKKSAVIAY
jgi:hypothetical protein